MNTSPAWNAPRTDLIQSVQFDDKDRMIAFCQAIQYASPINSHFTPYANYMPGYEDDVIMAAERLFKVQVLNCQPMVRFARRMLLTCKAD